LKSTDVDFVGEQTFLLQNKNVSSETVANRW